MIILQDCLNIKDIIKNYYDKIVNQNSKLHSWVWYDYERILSQLNPKKLFFENEKTFCRGKGFRILHSWNYIT